MNSVLVENLKKRAAELMGLADKQTEKPITSQVSPKDYRQLKKELVEGIEKRIEILKTRSDELYQAIDKLELEHTAVEDTITNLNDLMESVDEMPDQG